jgi:AraC-like DNA-binding protein
MDSGVIGSSVIGSGVMLPQTIQTGSPKPRGLLEHVETVKTYIAEHLYEPLNLSDLALRGGFSVYYFARRFKEITGVSPKQYILSKRLQQAYILLAQGNLTVSDIAYQTGFTDQSHLVRYFKKYWGMTPKALRHQSLEGTAAHAVTLPSPLTAPTPAPYSQTGI